MFNIERLTLTNIKNETYDYNFKKELNYFKGSNNSGKTEFYFFLDYMFGSSDEVFKKPWYKDSLSKAEIVFNFENSTYKISRTKDKNINYIAYNNDEDKEKVNAQQYKERINAIFSRDVEKLKELRDFSNEDVTYRTFTMFNFLGEKRQGYIYDFLDKSSNIKYSTKLPSILNYIFNNNLKRIKELQSELDDITKKIKDLSKESEKFEFVIKQVNSNLKKIGCNLLYNGTNSSDIRVFIDGFINMQEKESSKKNKNIADLEAMYNSLSEQIKIYESAKLDAKHFKKSNDNKKKMITKLQQLTEEMPDFDYLTKPIEFLLENIDNTISFSSYIISDNSIKELKKQREAVKQEIKNQDSRFKCFSVDEKAKSINIIQEFLSIKITSSDESLKDLNRRLRKIKQEIRTLQNLDDVDKIGKMSKYITDLYCSVNNKSSVVSDDIKNDGFEIEYLKKGNALQPKIKAKNDNTSDTKVDNTAKINYYIGSNARQTLMQLCGYFSFIKLFLEEGGYPFIPIFVIDHISKPFDHSNSMAIGELIKNAYKTIGKDQLQIFIFDDEEYTSLNIEPDSYEDLVSEEKSGFNPFYILGASNN